MAERERFGYTDAEGNRVSALRDMFDGGGRGRSGSRFEGGGIISSIGNAMGGPAAFGGGGGDNRGAAIGRTVGGMMFGPLGMIGGGILGNMIGRGRGSAQAPRASMMPVQRPSMPAAVAMAPPAPAPRPYRPTAAPAPLSAQPGFFSYPQPNTPLSARPGFFSPPPLPGAVPYNLPMMTIDAVTGLPIAMTPPRVQ